MYLSALLFALVGISLALAIMAVERALSPSLGTEPARRPFESGA